MPEQPSSQQVEPADQPPLAGTSVTEGTSDPGISDSARLVVPGEAVSDAGSDRPSRADSGLDLASPLDQLGGSAGEAPATATAPQQPGEDMAAPPALVAEVVAETASAEPHPADDMLEELILPSSIQAPQPLPPGTALGPNAQVQITELLRTRGRINQYAAIWRHDDGTEIEVELRQGPVDDAGLQRESEILTAIQYAMLPHCYLTWEAEGDRYLVIDPVQGETLEQALPEGQPFAESLSLVLQVVQVVRRIHQAGWALLGLSPADITLGKPLRVGQLRHAGRIGEPHTQGLHVVGYSAPELASAGTVTGKEDVYTLGALLYHALTGHRLSEGGEDTLDLSSAIRLPGGPQLLADVLTPADERMDIDTLYRRLLTLKSQHANAALSLEVTSATSVGLNPTRLVNEDTCAYAQWSLSGADGTRDIALLCVADGMGGMAAGEVASQTAVNVVMRGAASVFWPAPSGADTGAAPRLDPVGLIREAAPAVHAAGQGRDLGTTITAVAVHDGLLTLGHVGDTRAYLFRAGVLTRLTADHSLVAAMVASGVITPEEADGHPDSNKVLRSLGSQRVLPDTYVDDLQAAYGQTSLLLAENDWLLLCSDGVWGSVDDREILAVLTDAADHHAAARTLIDRALAAGAPDNATAIVARSVLRSTL